MPAFDPAAPPSPLPTPVLTKALWDTGASRSVISADLAKKMALAPVGQVNVNHAGGSGQSLTYMVTFALPNKVVIAGVLATELPGGLANHGFDVILGMDVITLGDFSLTNVGGKTCMTFRTPSCMTIDYVDEFNRLFFAGSGRNDACRCGSGKKFKKCHGA